MIEVARSLSSADETLRRSCLEHRAFAQESYLEGFVKDSEVFDIKIDELKCGYALVRNNVIVEFYVEHHAVSHAAEALAVLVQYAGADSILCQSFDDTLMTASKTLGWHSEPVAHLFRKFDTRFVDNLLVSQLASAHDMGRILAIHDGFFDDEEEIKTYMTEQSRLFIYQLDGMDMACGIIKQILPWRQDYDIGMVVAPEHRGRGYGAIVLSHLKSYCLDLGWHPVAGCSIDNLASKRSLERAGFVSEHVLVRSTSKIGPKAMP